MGLFFPSIFLWVNGNHPGQESFLSVFLSCFAYQALQAERDIGLLMPCNVIVYEQNNRTFISATQPTVTMNVVKNDKLGAVAAQVEAKLRKVVDSV